MVKNTLIFLFFHLVYIGSVAQNIHVDYKTLVFDPSSTHAEYTANELIAGKDSSVYYSTILDTVFTIETGAITMFPSKKRGSFQFKNRKKKEFRSYRQFSDGLVIDSTYSIKWKIGTHKKNILGYECQEATGHFRGRDYKAYFTVEIPIKEGPFKFDGLPGLILQVLSDDGVVKINAIGVKKTDEQVVDPFADRKHKRIMNWEEYVKIYEKQFKKFDAMPVTIDEKSGSRGKTSIPKRFIEVVVQ